MSTHCGQGHWWQRPQRIVIGVSSPRGCHSGIKTQPYPIIYRFHCWNTSGQTTSRVGTQTHPSAERVPEAILSSQPPINMPPWHGPAHQRDKTQIHPPVGRLWFPPNQETCTSLRTNLNHQMADNRSRRNYDPPASRKETTNTESQIKWDGREICLRQRNTRTTKWGRDRQTTYKRI